MNKRIVYNRHEDGGVSICCPTDWAIDAMCNGGAWPDLPWYYPGFEEIQIERQIARGIRAEVAQQYARAMMVGGCTTAQALEIIRDRDCELHGYAIELWNVEDVPSDRWYRNAWRRSHNGGPIAVDLELAKPIQWERARVFVKNENERRAGSFIPRPLIEVDWDQFRERIVRARCEIELREIWPATGSQSQPAPRQGTLANAARRMFQGCDPSDHSPALLPASAHPRY